MPNAIARETQRLSDVFVAAGAVPLTADILLRAETLLDLYGEDIRGRAYVTADPLRGEMMLRPDFTVPVVQMHMKTQVDPARYTYAGPVFRRQENDDSRAIEFTQVGFEVFDGANTAASDADVFVAISHALDGLPARASVGDLGLLLAAVSGLQTTDVRKAALLRHIWRPHKFLALLKRFGGGTPVSEKRKRLLSAKEPLLTASGDMGLRSQQEIEKRIAALKKDAQTPPISTKEVGQIEELLAIGGPLIEATDELVSLATTMPAIAKAVDQLKARNQALSARGVDIESLYFEASYGRTTMEYYDGFVFGFYATGTNGLPPLATGGRYDALTAQLGQGREQPAVGAVIRPDLVCQLREEQ